MTTTILVPVFTGTIKNQSVQLCNARDLHAFLEVGRDFATWIKDRIAEYGFAENDDYHLIDSPKRGNQKSRGGDRRSKDYHLTLDMGKELGMVERNEKGRQVRRYFIECERRASTAVSPAPTFPKHMTAETFRALLKEHGFDIIEGTKAIQPPTWERPIPAGMPGAIGNRTVVQLRDIITSLNLWVEHQPFQRDTREALWNALSDIEALVVTNSTEIQEAICQINVGMSYLNRWRGVGSKPGTQLANGRA